VIEFDRIVRRASSCAAIDGWDEAVGVQPPVNISPGGIAVVVATVVVATAEVVVVVVVVAVVAVSLVIGPSTISGSSPPLSRDSKSSIRSSLSPIAFSPLHLLLLALLLLLSHMAMLVVACLGVSLSELIPEPILSLSVPCMHSSMPESSDFAYAPDKSTIGLVIASVAA
jgi:hypothetical protein